MPPMRGVLLILALAASPAAAQVVGPIDQMQLDALRMQQENAGRRLIDQQNQLMAAEAQARADRAVLELRLERDLPVRLPAPVAAPLPRTADAPGTFPSIPDAALAESNRRIRDATRDRR